MEVNGWKLYVHRLFADQLTKLTQEVSELHHNDPTHYQTHPKTKFLATVNRLIRQTIPTDPTAPEYRQGNTLGTTNKHWFRAKLHGRYRLFFRFSSQEQIIVYVWLNDEKTLRKAGAITDPYAIFQKMLRSGNPPQDFDQLLNSSTFLDGSS
jgi:toxin YhaV